MFLRRTQRMQTIDAHQHLWAISERTYSWITPDYSELHRDFTFQDFLIASKNSAIDGTVLVQSADTYEDTFYMLHVASGNSLIRGVVGWVPLDRPEEAKAALNLFRHNPQFKGVRNLTHDYSNSKYESDDRWILRNEVLTTLKQIAEDGLTWDYVAVNQAHLESVIDVATKIPNLRIVIDHFGKPNIAEQIIEPWQGLIKECSTHQNIHIKFSGLNTASRNGWQASDWQPYFEIVYENFGPERILMGGDWPVITLMDNYQKVWDAQMQIIAKLPLREQILIRGGNAIQFYKL